MEASYTVNNLPLFGGILIFLLVLFTSGGEIFSTAGLPKGGYRYYIGSTTVLYILAQKSRCRVYILEGQPPKNLRVHRKRTIRKRTIMYVEVQTPSLAEAELLLERAYKQ